MIRDNRLTMSVVSKVLLTLALVVPTGGFVAGTLVASSANDSGPRETILIEDTSGSTPSESSNASPVGEQEKDDGVVEEVSPSPEDIGDSSGGEDATPGSHNGPGSGGGNDDDKGNQDKGDQDDEEKDDDKGDEDDEKEDGHKDDDKDDEEDGDAEDPDDSGTDNTIEDGGGSGGGEDDERDD